LCHFCLCVDFESVGTVIHSQVDYSRLAGKSPVLLLNTEGFDWASLRDCRNKFLEGRAKADNVDTPLVTVLMTIKVSSHLSISMSPKLFVTEQ
jgi:platelet-activating factor acetylhydrolase